MKKYNISPFIKWVGGKTQLLSEISSRIPSEYKKYYEPFLGGGAVLFNIQPQSAIVNDINPQLVNAYVQIRDNPLELIKIIEEFDSMEIDKEVYYSIREQYNNHILNNDYDTETAALMIWLNKHCFNGLYRVNKKGLFNVPFNNKTKGNSINNSMILDISKYLKKVTITCLDFEKACEEVSKEDFVYFDSPYIPESETADFTSYTKYGFSYEDHVRLAELFKELDRRGAFVMLSNNDVSLVRELYSGYNMDALNVHRMINSDASKRKGKEVIITNY